MFPYGLIKEFIHNVWFYVLENPLGDNKVLLGHLAWSKLSLVGGVVMIRLGFPYL